MPNDRHEKTESALSRIILLAVLIATVFLLVLYGANALRREAANEQVCDSDPTLQTVTISGGNGTVVAEVAKNKSLGLSGRDCLDQGRGMLFVYQNTSDYCFWMKDMNFSIDMVWLDEAKNIVTIHKNATPDSYPATFCPTRPAMYILEVPTGYSSTADWQEGTQLQF